MKYLKHPSVVFGVLATGVLMVLFIVPSFFHTSSSPVYKTADSPADFQFEIADTDTKRRVGLSGRTEVPHNYGMLFVFDVPDRYGFWMKDMRVPIDIIWLRDDGTIIEISSDISPSTYPEVFYPPEKVSYVLETAVGEAQRQGWRPKDRISLPR